MLDIRTTGEGEMQEEQDYAPSFSLVQESDEMQTVERAIGPTITPPPPPSIYYLRICHQGRVATMETNLPHTDRINQSPTGMAWLIGRSRNCAIVIPDASVSRCHAVVGYDYFQGLYVMDMGSSNGTFLDQQRLTSLKRCSLKHGQLLQCSQIQIRIAIESN
jgi:hypothetical protein